MGCQLHHLRTRENSKKEIRTWHSGFLKDCPSGKLYRSEFTKIYIQGNLFPVLAPHIGTHSMNVVHISYITCSMFRVNSVGFSNFWYRTYNQNLTGSRGEKSDATTVPHGHFRKLIIPTEFTLSMFQHALELIQKQNLVFSKRRSDFIRKVSLICAIFFAGL